MFCLNLQFIWHPLMYFLVFLKDQSLGSTYLFITVLCNSIKHSKCFLFADTIKIACSISSATDSTLPQSHINSIHSRCAADWMEIDTEESKVQCWLCFVLNIKLGLVCVLTYSSTTECYILLYYTPVIPQ